MHKLQKMENGRFEPVYTLIEKICSAILANNLSDDRKSFEEIDKFEDVDLSKGVINSVAIRQLIVDTPGLWKATWKSKGITQETYEQSYEIWLRYWDKYFPADGWAYR